MKQKKCNCNRHKHQVCDICQGTSNKDKQTESPLLPLTFRRLREVNLARCNSDIRSLHSWTPLEWGGCIAGETGELCNFLKKIKRGDKIPKKKIEHELADIVTYTDLVAAIFDIDLGEAVRKKFNIVSKRWNSKFRL